MTPISSSQIRQTFLDYFKKQGHTIVPSSSLIPYDDPTLLFNNAGMNQFKNAFLGIEQRDYVRAASSQKCVRAGGKHNDLDNVGFTARHHTFFEMLGNFSFGDYFKREAIHYAWDLLTNEFQIPKEKLYVTVYKDDDEAFNIWHEQEGVPRDRIFRLTEDNFWRMGEVGPCGPSSEIFYDHGPSYGKISDPFESIKAGEDRYVEIWNLVFMQFDEQEPGKLILLPAPSVDTGSGLERLTAALQGRANNYNTDLFLPLVTEAARLTGQDLEQLLNSERQGKATPELAALRVVADHARSTAFLLADQVRPSNEGRGYVLRRIIRRGIRYAHKLSEGTSVLPKVSRLVIDQMKAFYPELDRQQQFIVETLLDEEKRFFATLSQGSQLLQTEFTKLKQSGQSQLAGETLFKLYDTFGFPVDLTQVIANEQGFSVDQLGFEKQVKLSKEKSRASWKGKSISQDEKELTKWAQDIKNKFGVSQFVGYQQLQIESKVLSVLKLENNSYALATEQTSFYPMGGGQASDLGYIEMDSHRYEVIDVIKKNDIILHFIEAENSPLEQGKCKLVVDQKNRTLAARHHSATHLLHAALRQVLGTHVSQAGSAVDAQRLRFDFAHNKALTSEELLQVEELVNQQILLGLPIESKEVTYQQAMDQGALAFFQDKYGETVRLLKMGSFSTELCGGTHAQNTAEIGLMVIVSESSVSSGIRRIEALVSESARTYLKGHQLENTAALKLFNRNSQWEQLQKNPEFFVATQIEKLKLKIKDLEKQSDKKSESHLDVNHLVNQAKIVSEEKGKLLVYFLPQSDRQALMSLSDLLKVETSLAGYLLVGQNELSADKPVVLGVNKALSDKFSAGTVFKALTQKWGGKGGGRADLAQGSLTVDLKQQNDLEEFIINLLRG